VRLNVLDQTPTTITTSTLAGWLATAAVALFTAMWGALRWFIVKQDRRFEQHLEQAEERDKAIQALEIRAEGFERQHGETRRVLARMEKQLDNLSSQVNSTPERVVALLSQGRSS
jgi:flagellar biosynthesis/type III secretory pathway M-ring protein FliF/YscJ